MVDSHCEIMWYNNSGSHLGRLRTADYVVELDVLEKRSIVVQQRLRSNMLGLWTNNSMTTHAKRKSRAFKTSYTYNN